MQKAINKLVSSGIAVVEGKIKKSDVAKALAVISASRHEANDKTFYDMIYSQAMESEPSESVEDWLETFGALTFMCYNGGGYKKWALRKVDPKEVKPHHNNQDDTNLADIRAAKSPDDVPPVVVDTIGGTIDGAHRAKVAKDDNWAYIWAWVPNPASKMTEQEIEYLVGENISDKERVERIKEISNLG